MGMRLATAAKATAQTVGRVRARTFFVPRAQQGPQLLYQASTPYNDVQVVEIPPNAPPPLAALSGARLLILDRSGNIHSLYRPGPPGLTSSYWDLLATLPALCPDRSQPMGILGLGAGTLARLVSAVYGPSLALAGWELDPAVVMAGRMYMGMQELEQQGSLQVHTGDALSPDASVPGGGFGCIAVDIFSEGSLPSPMTQVSTWQGIKDRLAGGGVARVMANLGQSVITPMPAARTTAQALAAMVEVFGEGQVSVIHTRNLDDPDGINSNTVAVTGDPATLNAAWHSALPPQLASLRQQYDKWEVYDMYAPRY